ncbi:hypothetical protein EJB05_41755, partial [Eragrostis curvula]
MAAGYDAASALAAFHDTRAGVRGLVESGVTAVPPIFLMPATASPWSSSPAPTTAFAIPVVDLSLPRSDTVELARAAATSFGLFHVTNHGVHPGTVDAAVAAVRAFHEQPATARSVFYSATSAGAVAYSTIPNPTPQRGQTAAFPVMPWRDSLIVNFESGDDSAEPDDLPPVCRDALLEYYRCMTRFRKKMAALLSEALGLPSERLEQAFQVKGLVMVCHYYPPCPEPLRVVGARDHTDASLFTVLAQDDVGGLQVRLDQGGGDGHGDWVDVAPVSGALLVVSNDEYKSVEHRVVIKSPQDVRISIAIFFRPAKWGESDFFGSLPELVTEGRPALYRSLTSSELRSYRKELGHARPSLHRFKIASDNS